MKIKTFAFALLIALFLPGAGELPADLEFKSLAVAPDGTVWIGTNQYLYYKAPNGELQKHAGQAGSVTNIDLAIADIAINGNEMLLATTKGAVLYTFNGSELLTGTTYTPDKEIRAIAIDKETKWIATTDSFYIMKGSQLLNIRYNSSTQKKAIQENPITNIGLSNEAAFIITDKKGYCVEIFTKDIDGCSGATTLGKWGPCEITSPLCIAVNSNGEQWYGSRLAGVHWQEAPLFFTGSRTLDMKDGLISDSIDAIALDGNNKFVYAGTSKGISKISRNGYNLSVARNYPIDEAEGGIVDMAAGAGDLVYAITKKNLHFLASAGGLSTDKPLTTATAVSIYPNPASDYVTIKIEGDEAVNVKISLLSINGAKARLLYQGQVDEGSQTLSFPLNGLVPGSYICSMNIGADYHASVLVVR